jgi:hypothetical protein
MLEEVGFTLLRVKVLVDTADELALANDLPQEALEAVDRHVVGGHVSEGPLDDFARGDQADVDERRKGAVEGGLTALADSVLVSTEVLQSVIEKRLQPAQRCAASSRPPELLGAARVVGEVLTDQCHDRLGVCAPADLDRFRQRDCRWQLAAIIGGEAPLPASWLASRVDQDAKSATLPFVELGHEGALDRGQVLGKYAARRDEHG